MNYKYALFAILVFAFLVRVAGIGYGLPLALHDDEQPFILGALKMMQLKTVLPVLHSAEFEPILPYLPYASYLYLPLFLIYIAGAAGWAFITSSFPLAELQNYLIADLSPFFLIARFLSVLAGVLTVYLVYRTAKNLFDERVGLIAALFLSTSVLHITLSMSARHWVWLPLVAVGVLAVLTQPSWSFRRRYLWAAAISGIGVGFNVLSATAPVIMIFYYIFVERGSFREAMRDRFSYGLAILFVALAAIPIVLYPAGLGFQRDISASEVKTLTGATQSFYEFLQPVAVSEPIMFGAAVLGLLALIIRRDRFSWLAGLFTVFYTLSFYFLFYYAHRFTLGLFPFMVILAGYGVNRIFKYSNIKIFKYARYSLLVIVIVFQVMVSLRLDYLALRGDSKSLARAWVERNLDAGEKIIVAGKRMRLATTKDALIEQELIDPASIRKNELAETSFPVHPRGYKNFYALNSDAVSNDEFYDNLRDYIKENDYKYIVITPSDLTASRQKNFYDATRGAELASFFGLPQEVYSLTKAQYKGWVGNLFRIREFGPPTAIYRIKS
jgi:hypothetical protein